MANPQVLPPDHESATIIQTKKKQPDHERIRQENNVILLENIENRKLSSYYVCTQEEKDAEMTVVDWHEEVQIWQKFNDILSGPMAGKGVERLPGIGTASAETLLKARKLNKASQLVDQFLVLGKDEEQFIRWLQESCGVDRRNAVFCFACLLQHHERFPQ